MQREFLFYTPNEKSIKKWNPVGHCLDHDQRFKTRLLSFDCLINSLQFIRWSFQFMSLFLIRNIFPCFILGETSQFHFSIYFNFLKNFSKQTYYHIVKVPDIIVFNLSLIFHQTCTSYLMYTCHREEKKLSCTQNFYQTQLVVYANKCTSKRKVNIFSLPHPLI